MSWVVRVKELIGVTLVRPMVVSSLAFVSSASGLMALARAATTGFIDDGLGRVVPMYGVPVTIGPPVVKYGPAPIPTATISPITPPFTGLPAFDWSPMFPSFSSRMPVSFTAPDFSHMMPSFSKLFGLATSDVLSTLAFVAYVSLLVAAVCGLALRGSAWYLTRKYKE